MAFPSVTYSPTDVVIGHTSLILLTPSVGTAVPLKCKVLDYDGENELLRKKFPDTDGVARVRAVRRSGATEMFLVETREYKKLVTLLGGAMTKPVDFSTAQVWIRDYDDAATKTALKTDAFSATVYRQNGANRFEAAGGDDAGTPIVLVIESTKDGDVTFTIDATA